MRISDWSSDVCSSDLPIQRFHMLPVEDRRRFIRRDMEIALRQNRAAVHSIVDPEQGRGGDLFIEQDSPWNDRPAAQAGQGRGMIPDHLTARGLTEGRLADLRSEEHTSELQSLMRISYAVFCVKKNKQIPSRTHTQTSQTVLNHKIT